MSHFWWCELFKCCSWGGNLLNAFFFFLSVYGHWTYQDPSNLLLFHPSGPCGQRSQPLWCSRRLSGELVCLSLSKVGRFFLRWPLLECLPPCRVTLSVAVPPLPLQVLFGNVAGVASPLCVNSALIQKLFYAVNRACDRQRGTGWVEPWGFWGGGADGEVVEKTEATLSKCMTRAHFLGPHA